MKFQGWHRSVYCIQCALSMTVFLDRISVHGVWMVRLICRNKWRNQGENEKENNKEAPLFNVNGFVFEGIEIPVLRLYKLMTSDFISPS